MRIFHAIGLGLTILVLKALMGDVFHAFETTLLHFFSAMNSTLDAASVYTSTQKL